MTHLEELENYAYINDIDVLDRMYKSVRKGSCMSIQGQPVILLNGSQILDTADKTCVLAEEIGHVQTGTLLHCEAYLRPDYAHWLKRKNKLFAQKWAINELLPPERIQDTLDSGYTDEFELAEELNVTVDFLRTAINYYGQHGIQFRTPED